MKTTKKESLYERVLRTRPEIDKAKTIIMLEENIDRLESRLAEQAEKIEWLEEKLKDAEGGIRVLRSMMREAGLGEGYVTACDLLANLSNLSSGSAGEKR